MGIFLLWSLCEFCVSEWNWSINIIVCLWSWASPWGDFWSSWVQMLVVPSQFTHRSEFKQWSWFIRINSVSISQNFLWLPASANHPGSRLLPLQQGLLRQPGHHLALCLSGRFLFVNLWQWLFLSKSKHHCILVGFSSLNIWLWSQGTTFNFLAIGGLLLAVAEMGFMGEMEPRLVSYNFFKKAFRNKMWFFGLIFSFSGNC